MIEQVICGGENYDGQRPCHYQWVCDLFEQCRSSDVTFCFFSKPVMCLLRMAYKSGSTSGKTDRCYPDRSVWKPSERGSAVSSAVF
ncbi:MAG: DUF5131 family protein [Bulleidia sp.]